MTNRRDFIKAMMVLGVVQSGIRTDNYPARQGINNPELPVGPTTTNIIWNRNIFCQFDNEGLKKAVEKCAIEADCSIFLWGFRRSRYFCLPCLYYGHRQKLSRA